MPDPYLAAARQIDGAALTPGQKHRARQLLDRAGSDNGCVALPRDQACTVFGVGSDGTARRILGRLKAAGVLYYGSAGELYLIRFRSWTAEGATAAACGAAPGDEAAAPAGHAARTRAEPARGRAEFARRRAHPAAPDAPRAPGGARERPARAKLARQRAKPARPRALFARCRAVSTGVKGGRDINPDVLTSPSLPQGRKPRVAPRSAEQEVSYRLLTECLKPPVQDRRAADETARAFTFDTIYAHALRYLADLAEGKTNGPGALLYRIHHPETFPPRTLSAADYEDPLYAAAWDGNPDEAARRRKRYYLPEGYEHLINY